MNRKIKKSNLKKLNKKGRRTEKKVKKRKKSHKKRKFKKIFKIKKNNDVKVKSRSKRAATARKERLWEHGIIPYEIEANFSGELLQPS